MIAFDPDSELPTLSLEPDLLLVGVSTRAAAFSARRAGLKPLCIDQFNDLDLQAVAKTILAPEFPEEVDRLASVLPPIPVVYGGGCENRPDLIHKLAEQRPLWGNPPDVLRRIRDPFAFHEVLTATRLPALDVKPFDAPPLTDGTWLVKPRHSGGGRGIHIWTGGETVTDAHYFQKFQTGETYSAVFIAGRGQGDVRFVGITKQLIGLPEFGAAGFQWTGNIGPVNLDIATEMLVRRLGNILKWKFELVGLFGIDFIVDAAGTPWPTEVNPRYTASVELLEWACEINLLGEHCRCFDPHVCVQPFRSLSRPDAAVLGKAVLYATANSVPPPQPMEFGDAWQTWPVSGDIAPPDTEVAVGTPICTVYAAAGSTDECLKELQRAAAARAQR
jgi:predicted ATP-grasp superfamily ATP-dependent carboligase